MFNFSILKKLYYIQNTSENVEEIHYDENNNPIWRVAPITTNLSMIKTDKLDNSKNNRKEFNKNKEKDNIQTTFYK